MFSGSNRATVTSHKDIIC